MTQRLIYHWKHGWIPLDHYAALQKAHHRESGAVRLMSRLGIKPGDGKSTYAEKTLQHTARETPGAPHFRMSGTQLKDLAGRGDKAAQAELDRRAARKSAAGHSGGHKPGVPFQPSAPAAPKAAPPKPAPKPRELTPAEKADNAEKMFGTGSPQHLAGLNAENRTIEQGLRPGYTISSKNLNKSNPGLLPRIVHTQYFNNTDTGRLDRVGSVINREGQFQARLDGFLIGTFSERAAAHQALATAHEQARAEAKRKAAEKAARDARQAEANRKKAAAAASAVGRTGGIHWQPHTVASDGTRYGDAAAAKVKQAFIAGNKKVIIETAMSKANTQALLTDLAAVVDKANLHGQDVTFHVPTGDRHFRSSARRGTTGAYVRVGQPTVFIHPSVANGKIADSFGEGGRSAAAGHFMPAAKTTPGRQYVITHEMGHLVDQASGHTSAVVKTTHLNIPVPREDVTKFVREQAGGLSGYGHTNNAEAYAEAFAQWVHGGPGSSPAADAFARRFGWPTPRTS